MVCVLTVVRVGAALRQRCDGLWQQISARFVRSMERSIMGKRGMRFPIASRFYFVLFCADKRSHPEFLLRKAGTDGKASLLQCIFVFFFRKKRYVLNVVELLHG